jgi:hypothetical protein
MMHGREKSDSAIVAGKPTNEAVAVGFSGEAPSVTMGERHPPSHRSSKSLSRPSGRFIFSHHHVAAVLVALAIAPATASMWQRSMAPSRACPKKCSRAGARSRRDRLYTRTVAREIVRRERLITTSSGK